MTEVDSLALCQLSYLKFDGMVPGRQEGAPPEPGAIHAVHSQDSVLKRYTAVHGAVHNHLVKANDLYERRRLMDNDLNQWILSLNEEQLRTFVDTLYQVITAC